MASLRKLLATLGPGFLLAGAAIGVSHLVQATRAGADYGFALWWVLLFACLTKYPFLEFGPRYAAATGETLLTGYRKLGHGAFSVFLVITFGTMFIIQAAVTIVTAGLAEQLFQLGLSPFVWSMIILLTCVVLLLLGRYRVLDLLMKTIVSLLAIGTFVAVLLALQAGSATEVLQTPAPSYWTAAGIAFLIALAGWMPIPLDASVWHSIWLKEKSELQKQSLSLRSALVDFNAGYLIAAGLGFLFFLLGALIMFGNAETFSPNSVAFSGQLADLYASSLGAWSRPLVIVAAFTAMFSTTLAVTDAYPRVISHIFANTALTSSEEPSPRIYNYTLLLVPIASLFILRSLTGSFTLLIDFATGLSFVSAPILAYFNYRLVTDSTMPEDARPGPRYRLFSQISLVLLSAFALLYLIWRFFLS